MQQISKTQLLRVAGHYKGFILDKWGVLGRGKETIPNVNVAVRMMQRLGQVFILSNNSDTSPEESHQDLLTSGIDIPASNTLTSGMLLQQQNLVGKKVLNVGDHGGGEYIRQAGGIVLEGSIHVDDIEAVVVTRHSGFSNRIKCLARIAISRGVSAFVTNADMFAPVEEGKVVPVAGSIAREIGEKSDFTWLGKPHRPAWELAFSRFDGIPKDKILMIDDSLENIMAAINFGFHGLLVFSGLTAPEVERDLDSTLVETGRLHALPSISIMV